MNRIELLVRQMQDAYGWTDKVINSIPSDQWDKIPDVVESSVSWQAGHLIVSLYFHSVMVITGHQMDLLQKLPMREYGNLFTSGHPRNAVGKADAEQLRNHLTMMQKRSLEIIGALQEDDLASPLKAVEISHPIAKNKFEALDWNIKHTMWHCGQLGILKRVLGERYDFGLRV